MTAVVGALVLAAGYSRRFEGQKLTATINKKNPITVYEETINQLANAYPEISHIIAIIQKGAPSKLPLTKATTIEYPSDQIGIGESIAFGSQYISSWEGCLICLADMPFIRTETYKAIASRVTATNIVIPKFNGIVGNPIAFGKDHFQVLNELKGDEGARKVLKNHQNLTLEVETNDPGVLYDIDTPNDLLNAERRFAGLE
tara:strand:- start:3782 stop:4384 length:603 start_codon:yes stop_codon:yes gene_type:complete